MLVYLPMSYPLYAASILASNDLIRSSIAAAFVSRFEVAILKGAPPYPPYPTPFFSSQPLFARPMYLTLGIGPACSLLGGISIIMIPPMFLIKKYGATLRQKSKNATAWGQPLFRIKLSQYLLTLQNSTLRLSVSSKFFCIPDHRRRIGLTSQWRQVKARKSTSKKYVIVLSQSSFNFSFVHYFSWS